MILFTRLMPNSFLVVSWLISHLFVYLSHLMNSMLISRYSDSYIIHSSDFRELSSVCNNLGLKVSLWSNSVVIYAFYPRIFNLRQCRISLKKLVSQSWLFLMAIQKTSNLLTTFCTFQETRYSAS